MGLKLPRKKKRILWVSVLYRLLRLPFLPNRYKLELFLNLEWIFDKLAQEVSFPYYSATIHPARIYSAKFILDFIRSDYTVLDLGCGHGDIGNLVAEKARRVVGVELNEKIFQLARNKYKRENLTFVHGEVFEYLKQSTEKFDVLLLSHILEHLDTPELLLQDFRSYFRYIYIEVPDFDRYYPNHYRKDLNMSLIYSDSDHVNEFDRNDLQTLVKSCDLIILQAEYRYGVQKLWCEVQH